MSAKTTTDIDSAGHVTTHHTAPIVPSAHDAGDDRVMDLLHEHVPLALLCDLQAADGPRSAEILATEGSPDGAWWER